MIRFIEKENGFIIENNQDQIGEISFTNEDDATYVIEHTIVDPAFRGQDLAAQLVEKVVNKARMEGKKIVPVCSFAKREFDRLPAYQDVLK